MSYAAYTEHEYPRITPAVQALIAVNVAVAFLQYTLFGDTVAGALGFRWGAEAASHWWTALTYMFVHRGIWHLAMNMYALWLFGPRLEHTWGTKRFVRFYALGGLGALVFFLLFARGSGVLLGASGAIYGVMAAYAMTWPREEIYFFGVVPLRVWTLVLLLVGWDLAMGVYSATAQGGGDIAYFAHVGGFVVAWFYMRTPSGMSVEQIRQRLAQAPDPMLDEPPRAIPRTPRTRERTDETDEIVTRSKAALARPAVVRRPTPARTAAPDELNRVLDKISATGLESLSAEERKVLEDAARKLKES